MEILDTMEGKAPAPAPAREGHVSIDHFEATRKFEEREEEEKVEEAMALYARAARQRMQPVPAEEEPSGTEEEREARSQQLKLQQKCQDIAALIMVDELEEEEE